MKTTRLKMAFEAFSRAYTELLEAAQEIDEDIYPISEEMVDDYPFNVSFDELNVVGWCNTQLAKLGPDLVKITCYGKTEVMERQKAIKLYTECISASEGSEQERYIRIFEGLKEGLDNVSDEETLTNRVAMFKGQCVDVFEDLCEEKGIKISNTDCEEQEPDCGAQIYGEDYDAIASCVEEVATNPNETPDFNKMTAIVKMILAFSCILEERGSRRLSMDEAEELRVKLVFVFKAWRYL